jgi:hypothetical protein
MNNLSKKYNLIITWVGFPGIIDRPSITLVIRYQTNERLFDIEKAGEDQLFL